MVIKLNYVYLEIFVFDVIKLTQWIINSHDFSSYE